MTTFITMTCKAFSSDRRAVAHRIMIDRDAVLVYDDIARHYTTCHTMTAATQRRARKLAAAAE